MKHSMIFFAAAALVLASPPQRRGPATAGARIAGSIAGANGTPLPGATANLTSLNGSERSPLASSQAAANGRFSLLVSAPGMYRLWIKAAGYQPFDFPVVFRPSDRRIELGVRLVLDPAKNPGAVAGELPRIQPDAANAYLSDFVAIAQRFSQQTDAFDQAYADHMEKTGSNASFVYNTAPLREYFESRMRTAKDREIGQFASMYLVRLYDYGVRFTPQASRELLHITPPDSPMWGLDAGLMRIAIAALPPGEADDFLQQAEERNPDRALQARALLERVKRACFADNRAEWVALHRKLKAEYGGIKEIRFESRLYDPDDPVAKGKPVPDFEIKPLGGGAAVSNRSLLGRFYLIDFWATWCGPCVGELPAISGAYEKYKDKNFTILSVSLDETPEAVQAFQAKHWRMPWLNEFIKCGMDMLLAHDKLQDKMATDFEITWIGLPRMVLVSPEGTILATQDELRSDVLDHTLAKCIDKAGTAQRSPRDGAASLAQAIPCFPITPIVVRYDRRPVSDSRRMAHRLRGEAIPPEAAWPTFQIRTSRSAGCLSTDRAFSAHLT